MAKTDWDALDPQDLARLRDKKLRRQVRYQLYAFSPYYRRAFEEAGIEGEGFDGLADLPKMPVIERQALAETPEDFVLKPSRATIQRWGSGAQLYDVFIDKLLRGIERADEDLKHEYEIVNIMRSAGAEGTPVAVSLTKRDLAVMATQGMRALQVAGLKDEDLFLNLLDPSTTSFWAAWTGAVAANIEQVVAGYLDPSDGVKFPGDRGVTAIMAMPEDAVAFIEAQGQALSSLRTVILGPGPSAPGLKQRITEVLGAEVKIVSTYGFTEGRVFWAECAEGAGKDAGFHTSADIELFEAISPRTGGPAQDGEPCEILFTGLDQRGTALARYQSGDVATGGMTFGRCPYCNRIVHRIIGPIRRAKNLIALQLAGGDPFSIDIEALADALAHPGVANWQVEVAKTDGDPRGPDEVFVLFAPKPNRDPGRLAVELDRAFRTELGLATTQFVLSDRARGGIVDLRPVRVEAGVPRDPSLEAPDTPLVRLWRNPSNDE